MNVDFDHIYSWLNGLSNPEPPALSKRKSSVNMDREEDPKRRRLTSLSRTAGSIDSSIPSSEWMSGSATTERTSRSSSKKQLVDLEWCKSGLECRQIEADAAHPKVANLLNEIVEISMGRDILPHSLREEMAAELLFQSQNQRKWRFAFKEPEITDTLPGYIPTPDVIDSICHRAKLCAIEQHEEAAWNMGVHYRLLEAVFRKPGSKESDLIDFTPCTTARPHRTFLPRPASAKMVDFCLYFNDAHVADVPTLRDLAFRNPTHSVNHTDFVPLTRRPIAVSIETKGSGDKEETSKLQMGVWHAAQWNFLASNIDKKARDNLMEGFQDGLSEEGLAGLGFIPGVIIHQHQWFFCYSTFDDRKMVLWTKSLIGSTANMIEAYSIVAGLREIAGWARDVYLPWFQTKVLSIAERPPSQQSNLQEEISQQDE